MQVVRLSRDSSVTGFLDRTAPGAGYPPLPGSQPLPPYKEL